MTFSFTPVTDGSGKVDGIFHPVTETTDQVLRARRTLVLRTIAERIADARSNRDIYRRIAEAFEAYNADVPFLLFYSCNEDDGVVSLESAIGINRGLPISVDNSATWLASSWPFQEVIKTGRPVVVEDLANKFGDFLCAPYPEPPNTALVLPIQITARERPFGFFVAGVSARRAMDEEYTKFYTDLSSTINRAFSNTYSYEQEWKRADALAEVVEAQNALKESENRFRLMANAIPEIVWVTDSQGRTEFFNKRWEEFSGVPYEPSTASKVAADFIHPDDGPVVMRAFSDAIKTGMPMEVEQRNRAASGEYRWFLNRATPYRDPQTGEIQKWFGISTEIHERKEMQKALEDSEIRFRSMAEHSPTWVWMTDEHVNVSYANSAMLSYLGVPDYEVFSGHLWETLTHPDDIKNVYDAFGQAAQSRSSFSFESRVKNSTTGQFEWCLFKGAPHIDKGVFVGFIGTGMHIHQQKEMNTALELLVKERTMDLKQINRELERSNEDLQQFAHVASHDLKEPVRKIKTFVNRLITEYGESLPPRGRDFANKIESASQRISSMIDGVLLYSSVETLEGNIQDVDLTKIIDEILTDAEIVIEQKNAIIDYEGLPRLRGIPVLLYQLFYNLINNALKFSKTDSPPVVRIRSREVKEVEAQRQRFSPEGKFTCIVIEDNGIGFDQNFAEEIFITFKRLNSKDKFEGTGLGLALCKKIVERHGGTIFAQGEAGKGATFLITLPVV